MMMMDAGVRQQLLTRPKAEMCFRPWWDTIEDSVLVTMLGLGTKTQSYIIVIPPTQTKIMQKLAKAMEDKR